MARRPEKLFDSIAHGLAFMPANPTGLGCLFASILTMFGCLFVGHMLSQILTSDIPMFISWMAVAAGFIAFVRFAKRHS